MPSEPEPDKWDDNEEAVRVVDRRGDTLRRDGSKAYQENSQARGRETDSPEGAGHRFVIAGARSNESTVHYSSRYVILMVFSGREVRPMTAPEAKLEYRIERDGAKFVAIDSDEDTVGVFDSEAEAQAEIAREKKKDAIWERTKELMRAAVRTIMTEFSVDMETALGDVNDAAGMTVLGMEEESDR